MNNRDSSCVVVVVVPSGILGVQVAYNHEWVCMVRKGSQISDFKFVF